MKLVREPLLHFLLIGAAIYLAYGLFAEPVQQTDDKTITVTAGEIEYPQKDLIEIQKQFGSGFTQSLAELTPNEWHGPVLSGYGVHLVYVQDVIQPPPPTLADVRERVMQDWKTAKSEELNRQFYDSLREQYTVIIEQPDRVQDDSSQAGQTLDNAVSIAVVPAAAPQGTAR